MPAFLLGKLKPKCWFPVAVLALVFTLANPAGIAFAQTRRVLIVEHLEKEKKPKLYWKGDFIILHSKADDALYSGTIVSLTDSGIVLGKRTIPLQQIDYVTEQFNGGMLLKAVGGVAAVVGTVLIGTGLWMLADGWASPESQNAVLLGTAVPVITGLGYYFVTKKAAPRKFGPVTGWRLRIKTLN